MRQGVEILDENALELARIVAVVDDRIVKPGAIVPKGDGVMAVISSHSHKQREIRSFKQDGKPERVCANFMHRE